MNDELDVLIDGLNSIHHPKDLTFFWLPLLYGKTGKTQVKTQGIKNRQIQNRIPDLSIMCGVMQSFPLAPAKLDLNSFVRTMWFTVF
jgi:hypothetical protein